MWTVRDAIRWAVEELSTIDISEPWREAELLLIHVLGISRKDLLVNLDRLLSHEEVEIFKNYILRRKDREPLQYIVEKVEFRGLLFKVNRNVLIPRPETELLVEELLKSIKEKPGKVIDLCTGSGCIAISIAKEITGCHIYAVDISEGAIDVAKENAEIHGVKGRIEFFVGDLFGPLDTLGLDGGIDLIVTNPPYISGRDMESLSPEIKKYEPMIAIYGGRDGLNFYRRIIQDAYRYLIPGGLLMMEIGYGQAANIKYLFEKHGGYEDITIIHDLAGIERIMKARSVPFTQV